MKIRRDNVEHHQGRDARRAGKTLDHNPYTAGGERAERWALGWAETTPEKLNPIPFNPDTMTISQAKQCVEALSQLYDALDRGLDESDPNNVLFHMKQGRDSLRKQWERR